MAADFWSIEWNDWMTVGIPEIDEEHKHCIFLINEFNRSIIKKMKRTEIKKRIRLIINDAKLHFVSEEKILKKYKYPDIKDHVRKHAQVLKELRNVETMFKPPKSFNPEYMNSALRMKIILIDHILNDDFKYAIFCKKSRDAITASKADAL